MADNTKIEWTDATWNPITGCSIVSPGCTNCYAMKLAGTRLKHHPSRAGLTTPSKAGPVWNGKVTFNEKWLDQPLHWKKPRMIFVCAHGDLFAENVPDEWIDKVFAVMALCQQHTFQVLTKRPDRMREYMASIDDNDGGRISGARDALIEGEAQSIYADRTGEDPSMWLAVSLPLPNVWLGVSVEDQTRADERIPLLLNTPAAVRFISAEPLLNGIDIAPYMWPVHANWPSKYASPDVAKEAGAVVEYKRQALISAHARFLDWVIVGGESGKGARPMHPDWARSLRDQCVNADVPFFFKQWGEYVSVSMVEGDGDHFQFDDGATVRRVGKHLAGREIDGTEYSELPEVSNG